MITEKQLDQRLKKQTEEIKRHNDVLYEKFRNDIKTIGEGWDATSKKVDATFNLVGAINVKVTELQLKVEKIEKDIAELRLKVEKIEKDIEIMKSDISFIKNELKQKVDRDEFVALEKRLILLENKFKRV